jgi:hypothetical protein
MRSNPAILLTWFALNSDWDVSSRPGALVEAGLMDDAT